MKKVIIFNDHILPKDVDRELWSLGTTIKTVAYTDYQELEKQVNELKELFKWYHEHSFEDCTGANSVERNDKFNQIDDLLND